MNAEPTRVRLLRQASLPPLADEAGGRGCRPVREVLLECDGVPVIFAHSVLSTARSGRLGRWFAGLGSRSLGSLLFAHAGSLCWRCYERLSAIPSFATEFSCLLSTTL